MEQGTLDFGGRVRVDRMASRDREWYRIGKGLALALCEKTGECWPDDWSAAMRAAGHYIGPNLGSFWAWLGTQGFKQGDERRMSRDPERNGAKVFVWRLA